MYKARMYDHCHGRWTTTMLSVYRVRDYLLGSWPAKATCKRNIGVLKMFPRRLREYAIKRYSCKVIRIYSGAIRLLASRTTFASSVVCEIFARFHCKTNARWFYYIYRAQVWSQSFSDQSTSPLFRNWSYLVELENKRARRNDFHTIRRRNFMEDDNFHVSTRRRIEQRETRNTGYTRGRRRRRRKRKEKKKISRRLWHELARSPDLKPSQQIRIWKSLGNNLWGQKGSIISLVN